MLKDTYRIRVKAKDEVSFLDYVITQRVPFEYIGQDMGPDGGTFVYEITMDSEEELKLRLSFPINAMVKNTFKELA